MNPVVTRFAPSPTGYLHAGSYRSALFAYIFAKQHHGKFILRIEDTDKERSKKEYEDNIVDSLKWLGMNYDEFYRQSDRSEIYKKHLVELIKQDKAYVSKETKVEEGGRAEVIRFRNPNKKVVFDDIIRGRIEFDTTELGDFVIAKSMEEPIFHLVNVIDDTEMGVTHVIRGEDHISNTPRHILIYEALGAKVPQFAHIPLLLAPDRSKLSKRHGALPVTEYRRKGFLPEAILNYFTLLGWHPADDQEILSFEDIVREFSLKRVQKSGAIFDEEKLRWFNREYLKKVSDDDFVKEAQPYLPEWLSGKSPVLKRVLTLLRDKIYCYSDVSNLFAAQGELHFIGKLSDYPTDSLLWKKNPSRESSKKHLEAVFELLSHLLEQDFETNKIKDCIWSYVEVNGRGDVLWPLRLALTGQEKSPDPFLSAYALGKEESLARIGTAIDKLS